MSAQEIKVPDIGDFSDIPVIELHVAAGDIVAAEDPLVTGQGHPRCTSPGSPGR